MFKWHFHFRCGEISSFSSSLAPWPGVVTEQLSTWPAASTYLCWNAWGCIHSYVAHLGHVYLVEPIPCSGQTASDVLQLEGSPWSQKWLLCPSGESSALAAYFSLGRKWDSLITALAQSTPFFLMAIHSTRKFIYTLTGLVLIWISSHPPHQRSLVGELV